MMKTNRIFIQNFDIPVIKIKKYTSFFHTVLFRMRSVSFFIDSTAIDA